MHPAATSSGRGSGDVHERGRAAAPVRRTRRLLVLGAMAAGLATSTKYNLGMLVLPATAAAV